MILSPIESTYWSLPHEIRRILFRIARPRIYKSLQELRGLETVSGNSLKPFDVHRCIFVHIPKCAGVSVSKSLFGNLGGGHFTIRKYQIIFSKSEFRSYFKFTFVRNPWDRAVSSYLFLKAGGFEERDRLWSHENIARYGTFDAFVKGWMNEKNLFASWNHFLPQHWYICDLDGRSLVDFVGRFENIERDYVLVRESIGTGSRLARENVTRAKWRDFREYYTEESKQIVANVYRKDIKLFGYEF